ncbi:relaxation protein [Pseudoxanthomonas sp.]|uniref:relaxation protein n=1 Tax=Pseudoxanthomonas sp. TaxID=1871049 RepID=UPI0025DFE428|nr:relaxation protein [Pseudoxanthomonas sp.]
MDTDRITDLVASVSALMERFERRTQQIEGSLQAAHRQLQELSQQLPNTVRRAADTEMQHLRGSIASAVDAGIGQSVSTYQARLETSGQDLRQASQALAAQIHAARALYRHLLWKVVGVCLASLTLIVLGGSWLSRHYYDEIRHYQLSAQLLKAYDAADVTQCDGRLCANIDPTGDTFGEDDQYRPVRDRR